MRDTPEIICAICDKPVEKVSWVNDFNTNSRHITVYCHGDTDSTVLTADFLMEVGGSNRIEKGVAFQTKRIAE
jgi:hypothetical protein